MRLEDERLHQRIWELLPWYANGTLGETEKRTVEEHAAQCERCREEAQACRQLGEAVRLTAVEAPTPHPARLSRLLSRLDEAEGSSPRARLAGLLTATPRPVRWVLAGQLAALLLLATGLVWTPTPPPPADPAEYRTLSDSVAVETGQRVRVVFAESATERQIRDVLLPIGGQLAGGPSPLGVYTVELPEGRDPLPVVLQHLRSRPEVSFAEPIMGEGG
ncbi:MAG TPA: zf-HC2 domain-containing protein [Thermoanaerobaculia bacterium]|nr:zf-HC2 domain-containing protein [Thermoanaerobaculia bacterium]